MTGAPEAALRRDLVFTDVSVVFGERIALERVSVTLDQRRIGIIGSNGSGKSTFARMLNGLVTAGSGDVRIHGLDPVREAKQLRRRAGFIFANPDAQIIMPTVREDIGFSLRGRGLSASEVSVRVDGWLDRFGLTPHADAPAHDLSGGQKQLLAMSAVLIGEPALVIADEPTALLDASNRRLISDHLLDVMPQQLVLVTHDMRLAARCDIVLRFEGGRLHSAGEPRDVIDAYELDHA
ncbi:energy-coupling factor ABC transporter ATP-binding protein [Plantibacter sp. YIM 135347]|uniref:energy-coupling factor ABC transporter ATP-binding protein n=1 Tax=Plantibacter sp. YIM 135347 TaxID=3423919 RepID=UPI003D34AE2A